MSLRVEDAGTFFCSAENPAGVARANFTVRVLSQDGDSAVKSSVVQLDHHNSHQGAGGGDTTSIHVGTTDQQEDEMYKVGGLDNSLIHQTWMKFWLKCMLSRTRNLDGRENPEGM